MTTRNLILNLLEARRTSKWKELSRPVSAKPIRNSDNLQWIDDDYRIHRVGGPAVIYDSGIKAWYVHGKLHRDGGMPAITRPNGSKEWWVDDKRHRLDGPAVVDASNNGTSWWVDGKLHRLDGPAILRPDGSKEWWVDGKRIPIKHQEDLIPYLLGCTL